MIKITILISIYVYIQVAYYTVKSKVYCGHQVQCTLTLLGVLSTLHRVS